MLRMEEDAARKIDPEDVQGETPIDQKQEKSTGSPGDPGILNPPKPDPKLRDPTGNIGEHNAEIVEHLLESYVEGNKPSAVEKRFLEQILEQKAVNKAAFESQWEDLSEEDTIEGSEEGEDPAKRILQAAEKGRISIVTEMLVVDPDLVHSVDEDLYTPLHRASYNGYSDLVRFLLESGAKYDAKTRDGWIPLHCACRWNKAEVASLLIQAGSDVNSLTNGKQTPLHLAASNADAKEVLQLLLMNRWIDPTIVNDGHDTAYQVCRRSGTLYHLFDMTLEHMLLTKEGFASSEMKE